MAVKVCRAVKPRASTDEDTTGKPFRAVVAGGSTGVRSVVVVAVRACWFGSDVDADLSLCFGSGGREANYGNSYSSSESTIESPHKSSSVWLGRWRSQCTSTDLCVDFRNGNSSYRCNPD